MGGKSQRFPARRDDSLESLISSMTTAMSKGYEVNGKTYYLTSFGISTLGYMNSAKNEQYAYHINGDEDDSATSGKEDKTAGSDQRRSGFCGGIHATACNRII